jgi:hypothetical protein
MFIGTVFQDEQPLPPKEARPVNFMEPLRL